jgi:hypothetical protein
MTAKKQNGTVVISASITRNDVRLMEALRKKLDHTTVSETVRSAIRVAAQQEGIK